MWILKSVVKNLKRKKSPITLKFCPKCKQNTLYKDSSGNWTNAEWYSCSNCDYEGAFYLEVDQNEKGENFANLDKFKEKYPEECDPTTEIDPSSLDFKAMEFKEKTEEEDKKE